MATPSIFGAGSAALGFAVVGADEEAVAPRDAGVAGGGRSGGFGRWGLLIREWRHEAQSQGDGGEQVSLYAPSLAAGG